MKAFRLGPGVGIAYLSAHLSKKDGNQLDIFIEDEEGHPKAIPSLRFEATIGDFKGSRVLMFEVAPADERPSGEVESGGCSHFVAKANRMVAEAGPLSITAPLQVSADEKIAAVWDDFYPAKYAHHVD